MKTRLIAAMACYGMLALLAALTLPDLRIRALVWILLAGLALKTWIAARVKDSE
jgi:hypothetical protein